jgi:hypothetical protein
MRSDLAQELQQVVWKIDRPGSFCVSGSAPVVLPGLEVRELGPIGLPLVAQQVEDLKKRCEQAPYGKGEATIVDTNVRRVWRLEPEHFSLTNPEWGRFLQQTVGKVRKELGLEKQQLESHLYELLLYEPGSFFLPHRDGEKLDRMVATLVVVLPSAFQGGELVVRHEGQEQTIDFGSNENNLFRIHYAAFYADCEHEIRPLREGHRLCLVYNLTLKRGKKSITAPRNSSAIEKTTRLLRDWAQDESALKLVITLEHQYTQEGLAWDVLKGADRARAQILAEAASQADCRAYLALLTFHEAGSAEGDHDYYGRRGRWRNASNDPADYAMGEVYDSSLSADHWSDRQGNRLAVGQIRVDEDELLDPEVLRKVTPEEEFEGYTGNAGMTLDRWYRHGAIIVWPSKKHFEILCGAGSRNALEALKSLVEQWQKSTQIDSEVLRAQCVEFAAAIIASWQVNPHAGYYGQKREPCPLLPLLVALDEPSLVKTYLSQVMTKDVTIEPDPSLLKFCEKHGWGTIRPDLEVVLRSTTAGTMERNTRLLEQICLAKPQKKAEWLELCEAEAPTAVEVLQGIDRDQTQHDWRVRSLQRAPLLAGLARSLLATEQFELLSRIVTHALAMPGKYPLREVHVAALTSLQPWLEQHFRRPCPALALWIGACGEQLEALTEREPQVPADFRRSAAFSCTCPNCGGLKRFLEDPREQVYRYRAREDLRRHLENSISQGYCDLDLMTEKRTSPHTLVCTKNTASYRRQLAQFHLDQEHLATLRAIKAGLQE